LFQGPTGGDVIQLDVAILEGPVGNRAFNHDLWGFADAQGIAPETQSLLEENGLRVGQIGGFAPQELQNLLTSERSRVDARRIQLRSGTPRTLVLGPAVTQDRFVLYEKGRDNTVTLEQGIFVLSVVPALSADGRTRLQFTPEIQTGGAASPATIAPDLPAWQQGFDRDRQEQRTATCYSNLAWEITIACNDYLLIGGRYDRANTLGWHFFIRPSEDTPVQRLLVIRTTRSRSPVENEIGSAAATNFHSFIHSPSIAAQASGDFTNSR
jgi:hypothetical protein